MFDVWYVFEDQCSYEATFATEAEAEAYAEEMGREIVDTYSEGYEVTTHGEMPAL